MNDEDGTTLYRDEFDNLYLSDDTKDAYPGITKALNDYNSKVGGVAEGWTESELIDIAKQQKDDSEYFTEYTDISSSQISRLDDKVLSIVNSFSNYYGGAHGYYGNSGFNYDVATGEELSLLDVVSSLDDLRTAAQEVFSRDYAFIVENEPGSEEALSDSFNDEEALEWSLGPDALTLYYNPYYLASYASGQQVLDIRYEDYPNLFNKGLGEYVGDWVLAGDEWLEDIDGDGIQDYIHVMANYEYEEDYSYMTGITIDAGNISADFDLYSYETTFYLVHKADKYYIYVSSLGDSDCSFLDMYEISSSGINDLGEEYMGFAAPEAYYDYGEGYYESNKGLFYNPNRFYMSTRTQMISTMIGVKEYEVGDDGRVHPTEDLFRTFAEMELTSKVDLTLEVVNEDGETVDSATIPSGTVFTPIRTDNETFSDCELPDGRIVRVPVDHSEITTTVNGIDIEEAFDGVMFAG